ncbi:hypothetical protein Plhal703r1_c17g0081331 [Plasmopara halstedii]
MGMYSGCSVGILSLKHIAKPRHIAVQCQGITYSFYSVSKVMVPQIKKFLNCGGY